MSSDSAPTNFVILLLGASAFFLIMLLPALVELKKPKDPGPRRILQEDALNQPGISLFPLEKKEEITESDLALAKSIMKVISFLPNLET